MKTQIAFTNSKDPKHPIRISFRSTAPDEDGQRAGAEVEMSLEEARKVREMLGRVIYLVELQVWP